MKRIVAKLAFTFVFLFVVGIIFMGMVNVVEHDKQFITMDAIYKAFYWWGLAYIVMFIGETLYFALKSKTKNILFGALALLCTTEIYFIFAPSMEAIDWFMLEHVVCYICIFSLAYEHAKEFTKEILH